jgi:hypothetical protein
MVPIVERAVIIATDADILNGTRLNAIPYNGVLTFMVLADLSDATNSWAMTIQLPNGDVPVDSQIVPGSNPSLGGVLDDRQFFMMSFAAHQGGHFNISLVETGTAIATWQAVLKPA